MHLRSNSPALQPYRALAFISTQVTLMQLVKTTISALTTAELELSP